MQIPFVGAEVHTGRSSVQQKVNLLPAQSWGDGKSRRQESPTRPTPVYSGGLTAKEGRLGGKRRELLSQPRPGPPPLPSPD